MNNVYTDYLSAAAKAEYLIKSEDFIDTDKYLAEIEKIIIDHTDNKSFNQIFIVEDFSNNFRAPWNLNNNDFIHNLNGIYLEISNIFSYEIKELIRNKVNGIKELNIVKVTDSKVLNDKCLFFIEFVLDNEEVIVNSIYPITNQGRILLDDNIEKSDFDPETVYSDPDIFNTIKMLCTGRFNA